MPGLPLSEDLRLAVLTRVRSGCDALLDRHVTRALGVQFEDDYVGMGGLGGADGLLETRRGYTFGHVTRRLGGYDRAVALTDAVEACLTAS